MTTIYVPLEHKDVADRLARSETEKGGKTIFPTYMHVMVLAAMIGHAKGDRRPVKNRGPEIYDSIFSNAKFDGLAFLLALHEEKDGDILRDTRDAECWRILEEYAAAGLEEIHDWFRAAPSDADGVNTVLARMKEKAAALVAEDDDQITPDVDL